MDEFRGSADVRRDVSEWEQRSIKWLRSHILSQSPNMSLAYLSNCMRSQFCVATID